jgi:ribosomal protein S18 acetylase RimI-like enzyme
MSIAQAVSLRAATPDDGEFLRELFASTREIEFQFLDPIQREAIVSMQFNLQRQQYDAGYPDAEHSIITCEAKPIGRLFIDESDREITLVDIALLPAFRNQGIGRHLLEQLLTRATLAKKPVRLHVFKTNPARGLYTQLGFVEVGEDGMYLEMLREPSAQVAA